VSESIVRGSPRKKSGSAEWEFGGREWGGFNLGGKKNFSVTRSKGFKQERKKKKVYHFLARWGRKTKGVRLRKRGCSKRRGGYFRKDEVFT